MVKKTKPKSEQLLCDICNKPIHTHDFKITLVNHYCDIDGDTTVVYCCKTCLGEAMKMYDGDVIKTEWV